MLLHIIRKYFLGGIEVISADDYDDKGGKW